MSKRIKADVRIEHPWLRRLFFLILIAMIAGAGWYYVDLHTIKDENVVVTGNVHYTAEEIKEMVMVDARSRNSLYLSWVYKDKPIKDVPFIASMTVKVTAPDSIRIEVHEKKLAGYIVFLGENVYFDDAGVVMEITNTYTAGIPEISGILAEEVMMGEPLPVEDPSIFELILEITKTLEKYGINAQKIEFDENRNITVKVDNLRFLIGEETYLNEKFEDMAGILKKEELSGKKGSIDLQNDDGSKNFTAIFTPDE